MREDRTIWKKVSFILLLVFFSSSSVCAAETYPVELLDPLKFRTEVVDGVQRHLDLTPLSKLPLPVTVLRPLEFNDLTVTGVLTSVNTDVLAQKSVKTGDPDGKGVRMCDYSVEPKQCATARSCPEFTALTKKRMETLSRYDCAMKGFFVRACDGVEILEKARPSLHSQFQKLPEKNADIKDYPETLLSFFDYGGRVRPMCEGTKTFGDCAKNEGYAVKFEEGKIKLYSTPLNETIPDYTYTPAIKADINNDGWEDLVLFWFNNVFGGQYGYLCIEKPADSQVKVIPCH